VEAAPPPNRRGLMLGVGAVVFAALSGASGWVLRRTDTPDRARSASAGPRKVALDPARYYGHPVTAVTAELRRAGLRVSVRHQVVPGRRAGTVVGIAPSGEVPVGTTVVVYAARTPPSPSSRADGGDRTGGVARPAGEPAAPSWSAHKSKGQVKAKGKAKGHGKKG
jgi:eukaryotic-like serine/threonine-protein kinase